MDAATHILDGLAIGVGLAKGKSHPVAVAAVGLLGALAPDIDAVLVIKGWQTYRMYHRVYTHTFWALPILAALVTLIVGPWVRFEGWKFLYWTAFRRECSHGGHPLSQPPRQTGVCRQHSAFGPAAAPLGLLGHAGRSLPLPARHRLPRVP